MFRAFFILYRIHFRLLQNGISLQNDIMKWFISFRHNFIMTGRGNWSMLIFALTAWSDLEILGMFAQGEKWLLQPHLCQPGEHRGRYMFMSYHKRLIPLSLLLCGWSIGSQVDEKDVLDLVFYSVFPLSWFLWAECLWVGVCVSFLWFINFFNVVKISFCSLHMNEKKGDNWKSYGEEQL